MASTPRARGKRKSAVLSDDEMERIESSITSSPRSHPRAKLVSNTGKPLLSGEYLAGIARMAEANVPLEDVLRDFNEHVKQVEGRSWRKRDCSEDLENLIAFYKNVVDQNPRTDAASLRIDLNPDNDLVTTPTCVSPNHRFPFWDPRGHMIDLLAEVNDGLPRSYRIVKKIVEKAEDGDLEAAKELFNYTIGKPTQHVEMTTNQNINHYDVSADPAAFDVVVREEPDPPKAIEHEQGDPE